MIILLSCILLIFLLYMLLIGSMKNQDILGGPTEGNHILAFTDFVASSLGKLANKRFLSCLLSHPLFFLCYWFVYFLIDLTVLKLLWAIEALIIIQNNIAPLPLFSVSSTLLYIFNVTVIFFELDFPNLANINNVAEKVTIRHYRPKVSHSWVDQRIFETDCR